MKNETPETENESYTHFGYQQVPTEEKAERVAGVFHSVAARYDLMNDLMSLGIHRIWKRIAVERVGAHRGDRILDLAGGTGDLAAQLAPRVGREGLVVLADINDSMLRRGRNRLTDRNIVGNVQYVQANAEVLPFPENYFDRITIAFGLRNVTHKEKALAAMYRVLRPGGKLLVLEFSRPNNALLSGLYDHYSFKVLPFLGERIAGDRASYEYLAESIRMHPAQQDLLQMMQDQGLENCQYHNLSGGVVAMHEGWKY